MLGAESSSTYKRICLVQKILRSAQNDKWLLAIAYLGP